MNLIDGLKNSTEEIIKAGKEEAGTSAFNKRHDKLQSKHETIATRHLPDTSQRKVDVRTN